MTQLLLPLFFLVTSLPVSVPALCALLRTAPQHNEQPNWLNAANRFAVIGTAIVSLIGVIWLISYTIYQFGGCRGGLTNKVTCSVLPHDFGTVLYTVFHTTGLYLVTMGLPALGCYLLAEIITRRRKKAKQDG